MNVSGFAILRAVHVVVGSVWVGAALLNAAYLIPSVIAAGPAGGQVMRVMVQARRLPVFMNAVMAATLASGIWLYAWVSDGFQPAWIGSGPGLTFTLGALCAFATAAIGQFVTVPTVQRLGAVAAAIAGAGGPPSAEHLAEMGALQRRLLGAAQVGSALVIVATIAMAVARFV